MHSDQLITTDGQMFTVHRPDVLTSSVLLSQAGKGNDYSSAPPSRISSVFSFFLHLIPPTSSGFFLASGKTTSISRFSKKGTSGV